MTDSLTFFCTVEHDDMEDGEVLWTQPYKFDYPGAHEVQGRVRKDKDELNISLVLSSDSRDKRLSWPAHLKWTLFAVKSKDKQLKGTQEMTCSKEDLSKESESINLRLDDLIKTYAGDSVKFMFLVKITLPAPNSMAHMIKTQKSLGREILDYLQPDKKLSVTKNLQYVCGKIKEYENIWKSSSDSDSEDLGLASESNMTNSMTFVCSIDHKEMDDGEIFWTQPHKFAYPGAHEVQGGVKKEHDRLWVNLLLSSDPKDKRLTWPIHLKWNLFVVKDKQKELKNTREMTCKLEDLSTECYWTQSIEIQYVDLADDKMADALDRPVTLMWLVAVTSFKSPSRATLHGEAIATEIVHHLSPTNTNTSQQNVKYVSDKLQEHGVSPLSSDSDDVEEPRDKLMDMNPIDDSSNFAKLRETKITMPNSVMFLCTIDHDDIEDGEVLWTQPYKFDLPGVYEVQGGVKKDKDLLRVKLFLSSHPNDKELDWLIFNWQVSVLKDKTCRPQGSMVMRWNECDLFHDSNKDNWSNSIEISFDDLVDAEMVNDDRSVTLRWSVTICSAPLDKPVAATEESDVSVTNIETVEHHVSLQEKKLELKEPERLSVGTDITPQDETGSSSKNGTKSINVDGSATKSSQTNTEFHSEIFQRPFQTEMYSRASLPAEIRTEIRSSSDSFAVKDIGTDVSQINPKYAERSTTENKRYMDILLVGKTGNGKSSLGNSILRKDAFEIGNSLSAFTKEVQFDYSEFDDIYFKVVDGPGVGYTNLDNKDGLSLVINAMSEAICANPEGYHAILIVVRFGGKFTEEDVKTLKILKDIFGEGFIKDHAILVMTCGDIFHSVTRKSKETFSQWCDNQGGIFKQLLVEVQNRVVLFDNMAKDDCTQVEQLRELVSAIDGMPSKGLRYNNEKFEEAKKSRDRIIVESEYPTLHESVLREAALISQHFNNINLNKPEEAVKFLMTLLERAHNLIICVKELDRNTVGLSSIIEYARNVEKAISQQIKSTFEIIEILQRIREKRLQQLKVKSYTGVAEDTSKTKLSGSGKQIPQEEEKEGDKILQGNTGHVKAEKEWQESKDMRQEKDVKEGQRLLKAMLKTTQHKMERLRPERKRAEPEEQKESQKNSQLGDFSVDKKIRQEQTAESRRQIEQQGGQKKKHSETETGKSKTTWFLQQKEPARDRQTNHEEFQKMENLQEVQNEQETHNAKFRGHVIHQGVEIGRAKEFRVKEPHADNQLTRQEPKRKSEMQKKREEKKSWWKIKQEEEKQIKEAEKSQQEWKAAANSQTTEQNETLQPMENLNRQEQKPEIKKDGKEEKKTAATSSGLGKLEEEKKKRQTQKEILETTDTELKRQSKEGGQKSIGCNQLDDRKQNWNIFTGRQQQEETEIEIAKQSKQHERKESKQEPGAEEDNPKIKRHSQEKDGLELHQHAKSHCKENKIQGKLEQQGKRKKIDTKGQDENTAQHEQEQNKGAKQKGVEEETEQLNLKQKVHDNVMLEQNEGAKWKTLFEEPKGEKTREVKEQIKLHDDKHTKTDLLRESNQEKLEKENAEIARQPIKQQLQEGATEEGVKEEEKQWIVLEKRQSEETNTQRGIDNEEILNNREKKLKEEHKKRAKKIKEEYQNVRKQREETLVTKLRKTVRESFIGHAWKAVTRPFKKNNT